MHVHEEVLAVANEIVADPNNGGVFTLSEVLRRLPHLNERTVRTHVGSRCCVNAPSNHPHRWGYFRRVGHGRYQVVPKYRQHQKATKKRVRPSSVAPMQTTDDRARKVTIHAIVNADKGIYTAECVEIAVVTQGRSLDDLLKNLNEAIVLHLEGEDLAAMGLVDQPRLQLLLEAPLAV
jgi:predicted RNase H-like HicB family nuclease